MDANDLEIFRRHTGRQTPRSGGYAEAVAVVGRQSGKTYLFLTNRYLRAEFPCPHCDQAVAGSHALAAAEPET
jgi:hypothetical protein